MIDFKQRLAKLKDRRQGTRERAILDSTQGLEAAVLIANGRDLRQPENYESLPEPSGIKYAVGAMAPVSIASTEISIREGVRVASTLQSMLETSGIATEHRLQGSVALDIHIEGHSDVDVLILLKNIVLYETPAVPPARYTPATDTRDMKDIVLELRSESEKKLSSRYHAANVNCKGNKSISLEGGSLARKVDIVPSCWHDNRTYQTSQEGHDRGVMIYNKGDHSLQGNLPFTHIHRINIRDSLYQGNLKRAIRLMKNIIADMPDHKKNIAKKLTSYDIAAIAHHMDENLIAPSYLQLALVESCRKHLSALKKSKTLRDALTVPDGTRKIFNEDLKANALDILHDEVTSLAVAIHKEINPYSTQYNPSAIANRRIVA